MNWSMLVGLPVRPAEVGPQSAEGAGEAQHGGARVSVVEAHVAPAPRDRDREEPRPAVFLVDREEARDDRGFLRVEGAQVEDGRRGGKLVRVVLHEVDAVGLEVEPVLHQGRSGGVEGRRVRHVGCGVAVQRAEVFRAPVLLVDDSPGIGRGAKPHDQPQHPDCDPCLAHLVSLLSLRVGLSLQAFLRDASRIARSCLGGKPREPWLLNEDSAFIREFFLWQVKNLNERLDQFIGKSSVYE